MQELNSENEYQVYFVEELLLLIESAKDLSNCKVC